MRRTTLILIATLIAGGTVSAFVPEKGGQQGIYLAKNAGGPPGLAKKGGVPPGLAKRFGPTVPAKAYIAVDPRHDDRAWFLIDGRWATYQFTRANLARDYRETVNTVHHWELLEPA